LPPTGSYRQPRKTPHVAPGTARTGTSPVLRPPPHLLPPNACGGQSGSRIIGRNEYPRGCAGSSRTGFLARGWQDEALAGGVGPADLGLACKEAEAVIKFGAVHCRR